MQLIHVICFICIWYSKERTLRVGISTIPFLDVPKAKTYEARYTNHQFSMLNAQLTLPVFVIETSKKEIAVY